jgi:hypothetical protein
MVVIQQFTHLFIQEFTEQLGMSDLCTVQFTIPITQESGDDFDEYRKCHIL